MREKRKNLFYYIRMFWTFLLSSRQVDRMDSDDDDREEKENRTRPACAYIYICIYVYVCSKNNLKWFLFLFTSSTDLMGEGKRASSDAKIEQNTSPVVRELCSGASKVDNEIRMNRSLLLTYNIFEGRRSLLSTPILWKITEYIWPFVFNAISCILLSLILISSFVFTKLSFNNIENWFLFPIYLHPTYLLIFISSYSFFQLLLSKYAGNIEFSTPWMNHT